MNVDDMIVVAYDVFFFSSRRRHTRFDCDWSSDVCSSDLFCTSIVGTGSILALKLDSLNAPSGWRRGPAFTWWPSMSGKLATAGFGSTCAPGSGERRVGKEWRSRGAADQ